MIDPRQLVYCWNSHQRLNWPKQSKYFTNENYQLVLLFRRMDIPGIIIEKQKAVVLENNQALK